MQRILVFFFFRIYCFDGAAKINILFKRMKRAVKCLLFNQVEIVYLFGLMCLNPFFVYTHILLNMFPHFDKPKGDVIGISIRKIKKKLYNNWLV